MVWWWWMKDFLGKEDAMDAIEYYDRVKSRPESEVMKLAEPSGSEYRGPGRIEDITPFWNAKVDCEKGLKVSRGGGECSLAGLEFYWTPPDEPGAYWWRKDLRTRPILAEVWYDTRFWVRSSRGMEELSGMGGLWSKKLTCEVA